MLHGNEQVRRVKGHAKYLPATEQCTSVTMYNCLALTTQSTVLTSGVY